MAQMKDRVEAAELDGRDMLAELAATLSGQILQRRNRYKTVASGQNRMAELQHIPHQGGSSIVRSGDPLQCACDPGPTGLALHRRGLAMAQEGDSN